MEEENTQPNDNKKPQIIVRTYMSDMAEAVRQNEMSVIKIALEEQKRRERGDYYRKIEGTPKKKLFWALGGFIIIIVAIGITYFVLQKEKDQSIPAQIIKAPTAIISYDAEESIDMTNVVNKSDFVKITENELNKKNVSGSIKALFLKETTDGLINPFPLKSLFETIKANAPDTLIRSFAEEYTLGVYTPISPYDKNRLFLIIKINNYDQAYAGMLEWEKNILSDLFSVYKIDINEENKGLLEKQWKDIIIKNKDARILYTNDGADILFYIFPDKKTLVITDSQEAIKEIITRLLAKQAQPL
jgi:hypothetical protein